MLLKRLKHIIKVRNLVADHQFGFRQRHSTIDQVHRITSIIENALENKKVCTNVFLDVAQAFIRSRVEITKGLPKTILQLTQIIHD